MRKSLIAGAIALLLLSPNVYALSVGSMEVDSHLGEPLDISIEIDSIDEDEFSTLEVSLASRDMFREAGIEFPHVARELHLELGPYDNGRVTISIKTAGAISQPFLHLLINISWSGGNILREYTALIDPSDYTIEPIAQAAAPETSLGLTKVPSTASQNSAEPQFKTVQSGESLSSIAALYRPSDVAAKQVWIAIFNLNQDAFPDANLNRLLKGARLQIPTEAQMNAVSAAEAIKQVAALTRPLVKAETAKKPKPASLVVGGGGDEAAADSSLESMSNVPLSASQNNGEPTSADAGISAISQTIQKEISESRDRDSLLKEELIAARGENKVLTSRMAQLEAQLSRMSQLLELQSNALQAINLNLEKSNQAVIPSLSPYQLDPADPTTMIVQPNLDGDSQTANLEKSLNEAPSEQSVETPVEPASPTAPTDQATAAMADVVSSPGIAPGASGDKAFETTNPDAQIGSLDSADIDTLNVEDRSQIQKSEARIAELEKLLQAQLDATQNIATDTSTAPVSAGSTEAAPAPATTVRVVQQPSETSLLSSVMGQASSAIAALKSMASASGISQEIWRLVGGIAVVTIGIMVLLGLRRRRDDDEAVAEGVQDIELSDSSIDIAEIATRSMQHEPDDSKGFDEELHGSSLFDLSDESFMASEVIQDDSSLFSMDDNDDSLSDMDSKQIGQQSATQSVDIDPIAEADVYLAYDRKEQAIEVLEHALSSSPGQSAVVVKLLGLYQDGENIEGFTRLFEASAGQIEDESDWTKIKLMAQDFVPGHKMLADDFDSSIPVLMDEVTSKSSSGSKAEIEADIKAPGSPQANLKLASSEDINQTLMKRLLWRA